MKKRILSLVLCMLMVLSVMPFGVSAASNADANKVKEIWLYDVQTPYAEYYPDYDFTIRDSRYTFNTDSITNDSDVVDGCWWYDETLKRDVAPNEAFVKGHIYTLVILLETNDGYEFDTDNLKAYINGNESIIIPNYTKKNTAGIKYTFEPSDYSMEVEYVNLTVTEPQAGERPDFSAKTDRNSVEIGTMASPHYIEGVAWYDCDNYVFLDPSDKFAENGNYEVYVVIKTTGDFYFSTNGNKSDVQVKVNGKVAEVGFSGEDLNHYLLVTCVFGEKFTEVSKVEIRNLTVPSVGENPDFDLTPFVSDAYYINAVYWTDNKQSGHPVTMKETDTFKAGHTYELQVWLRVNDGYKFRLDEDDCVDIIAYIDSEQAEVVLPGAETSAIITMKYTIPESRVISEVDVIEVDVPYTGRTPNYDAFCTTQGCNVSGVKWYDVTDGGYVLMGEDDTFVEGHSYRVNVMVETEGNYTFLMVDGFNEASGYINGIKSIAATSDDDTWLQLGYVFAPVEKDPSRIISEFEIYDIEAPVAGNLPDTDAFSTTPGCEVAEVKWYDFTEGTHVALPENSPFVEGRIYRVVVAVEAGAGYTFLMVDGYNEAVGYIDRKAAMSYGSHDEFLLEIALEFAPCEADPNKPSVIGILGDANEDAAVNIKDATAIQKHVAGLITLSETGVKLADVDSNTTVNIKDATAIQKHIAGMDTGFEIGKEI